MSCCGDITRVLGVGTSKLGEVFARLFVVAYAGGAAVSLAAFINHDLDTGESCEQDFSVWLLTTSVLGFVLVAFSGVLLGKAWVHEGVGDTDSEASGARLRPRSPPAKPAHWLNERLQGKLEPTMGLVYIAIAVWTVIGSVWFFNASETAGDCEDLRLYGLGVVIGTLSFMAVVGSVFIAARLAVPPPLESERNTHSTKLRRVVVKAPTAPSAGATGGANGVMSPATRTGAESQTAASPPEGGKADGAPRPPSHTHNPSRATYGSGAVASSRASPLEHDAAHESGAAPADVVDADDGGDGAGASRRAAASLPSQYPFRSSLLTSTMSYGRHSHARAQYERKTRARLAASTQRSTARAHTSMARVTDAQLRAAVQELHAHGFDPTQSVEHYLRATRSLHWVPRDSRDADALSQ